jgi:hypothetical protein
MPVFFVKALQLAAQMGHPNSIAAFAAVLACVVFYLAVTKGKAKGRAISIALVVAAVGVVALGCVPLLASTYFATHGLYAVRVVVLGIDGFPAANASVVCVPGGEKKSIAEGWECDISPKSVPADGKFTAYATETNAFLHGMSELHLGDDYSPVLTVQLVPRPPARVHGRVTSNTEHPLAGAYVWVVGHEQDKVTTTQDGGFDLSAYKAEGQMIQLHVNYPRYKPYEGLQQAGDNQIKVTLER